MGRLGFSQVLGTAELDTSRQHDPTVSVQAEHGINPQLLGIGGLGNQHGAYRGVGLRRAQASDQIHNVAEGQRSAWADRGPVDGDE